MILVFPVCTCFRVPICTKGHADFKKMNCTFFLPDSADAPTYIHNLVWMLFLDVITQLHRV